MNLASSEACLSSAETKSLLASLQKGLRTKGHVYNQIDTILSKAILSWWSQSNTLKQAFWISLGISMARSMFCRASFAAIPQWSFFLESLNLGFSPKKHVPMYPPMSLLTEPLRKPAKFVKIIWLIDPIRWLLVPIMGSWIQVDGCSLHGYDHPFFGLYRPGVARKVEVWLDQGGWSYSELEGGFTIDYEYFTLRPK